MEYRSIFIRRNHSSKLLILGAFLAIIFWFSRTHISSWMKGVAPSLKKEVAPLLKNEVTPFLKKEETAINCKNVDLKKVDCRSHQAGDVSLISGDALDVSRFESPEKLYISAPRVTFGSESSLHHFKVKELQISGGPDVLGRLPENITKFTCSCRYVNLGHLNLQSLIYTGSMYKLILSEYRSSQLETLFIEATRGEVAAVQLDKTFRAHASIHATLQSCDFHERSTVEIKTHQLYSRWSSYGTLDLHETQKAEISFRGQETIKTLILNSNLEQLVVQHGKTKLNFTKPLSTSDMQQILKTFPQIIQIQNF